MNCLGCGEPKKIDCEQFFGAIEWGVASNEVSDWAAKHLDVAAKQIYFEFRFWDPRNVHGAEGEGRGAARYFTNLHPFTPQPSIIPLRNELWFCSLPCMRNWFNQIIDDFEQALETGEGECLENPLPWT